MTYNYCPKYIRKFTYFIYIRTGIRSRIYWRLWYS